MAQSPRDLREHGRDAVAVVTLVMPVHMATTDLEAEQAWDAYATQLIRHIHGKSVGDLASMVAHLGNMVGHLVMRINPEDPYEVVQELAKHHQ